METFLNMLYRFLRVVQVGAVAIFFGVMIHDGGYGPWTDWAQAISVTTITLLVIQYVLIVPLQRRKGSVLIVE